MYLFQNKLGHLVPANQLDREEINKEIARVYRTLLKNPDDDELKNMLNYLEKL